MTASRRLAAASIALVVAAFALAGWLFLRPSEDDRPHLLRVQERGRLRVLTMNSPTTYFDVQDRAFGFEYDLAREFAQRLGVELEMVVVDRFADLFDRLAAGDGDLAAASITVTPERADRVTFGPPYLEVTQQVVHRRDQPSPTTIDDLLDRRLAVVAGSSHEQRLEALAERTPGLTWRSVAHGGLEAIFEQLIAGELDATLVDSHVMAVHRRFYPELAVAFSLEGEQSIAWALPAGDDPSLRAAVEAYFAAIRANGRFARIRDRHMAHLPSYDELTTHYFRRHVETRLPPLVPHFQDAEKRTGFDWKLLAATAYQESHWDPDAVSPTGVRGIMMLTRATARELGIEDRRDVRQSILAGARYLAQMRDKIPDRIEEPDRTWFALAAYNIGWGHVEDARVLTQRLGEDPDRWRDVARHLPLLSDPEYYPTTRFGYARGRQPVRYVQNIRSYYDILLWKASRGALQARQAARGGSSDR